MLICLAGRQGAIRHWLCSWKFFKITVFLLFRASAIFASVFLASDSGFVLVSDETAPTRKSPGSFLPLKGSLFRRAHAENVRSQERLIHDTEWRWRKISFLLLSNRVDAFPERLQFRLGLCVLRLAEKSNLLESLNKTYLWSFKHRSRFVRCGWVFCFFFIFLGIYQICLRFFKVTS